MIGLLYWIIHILEEEEKSIAKSHHWTEPDRVLRLYMYIHAQNKA